MVNSYSGRTAEGRRQERAVAMALSAWDLERTRQERTGSSRSRLIYLRTHKRLQVALEELREVPPDRRSLIEMQDEASKACLLVHGAHGSPADMKPLARFLHRRGFTVYALLLPGHGYVDSLPAQMMWRASLQEVRLRFRLLRGVFRRVHVIGFGFGAALAIHLARRDQVTSLALLAPALVPRVSIFERFFLRLKLHRLRWLQPRMGWDPEVLEAMESARVQVGRLRVPVYAAQCDDDERISPLSLRVLQKRSRHRASRFRVFTTGGHDILSAHGESALHSEILKFFQGKR